MTPMKLQKLTLTPKAEDDTRRAEVEELSRTRMKLANSTLTQELKLTPEEPPKTKTIVDVDEARDPTRKHRGQVV